jgi:hypothetical protein
MSPVAGLKNLRWVLLLPQLRRGLNDCARFAGFRAAQGRLHVKPRPPQIVLLHSESVGGMLSGGQKRRGGTPVDLASAHQGIGFPKNC